MRFLAQRFPSLDAVDILFVKLEGIAESHVAVLKMPMTEAARRLAEMQPALARLSQFRLLHFPLCVVPRAPWPQVWNTFDPMKVGFPEAWRMDPDGKAALVGAAAAGKEGFYALRSDAPGRSRRKEKGGRQ